MNKSEFVEEMHKFKFSKFQIKKNHFNTLKEVED